MAKLPGDLHSDSAPDNPSPQGGSIPLGLDPNGQRVLHMREGAG
jgi:hypothetical protein